MKAIIPVAGAGTKLRPLTYTQPKALIPIAGKTLLSVIVDQLIDAGVDDFVFVVGYLGEKIQRYIDKTYPRLQHSFVHQADRLGIGHAVWLTREMVTPDEPVIIVLGDTVADYDVKRVIAAPHSQIGVRKVDDPRSFGVAELDSEDRVRRVVEKPLIPKSNMAMVGIYAIRETEALFSVLDAQIASHIADDVQGEYHLTSALQTLVEKGIRLDAFRVDNWYDCGKKETLLSTNAILLRRMSEEGRFPERLAALRARYPEAVIIPPVHIGEGCTIGHAILGPNVSIGEHTVLQRTILHDSIIGAYAELQDVTLRDSVIGADAFVRGNTQSLNIGDNTEIDLG